MIYYITQFIIQFILIANMITPDGTARVKCHVLVREGYITCVNYETRNPDWVCYTLCAEDLDCTIRRGNWFKADADVPRGVRVHPGDYTGSGYDRGHMAPFASQCSTVVRARESFLMTNMTPQMPCFNRGVWKRLEGHVRDMAREHGCINVCSGAEYAQPPEYIGDISVPSSFWKTVDAGDERYKFRLENRCYEKNEGFGNEAD